MEQKNELKGLGFLHFLMNFNKLLLPFRCLLKKKEIAMVERLFGK